MTPCFVADIGNSRIKCALYKDKRLHGFVVLEDQIRNWNVFLAHCQEVADTQKESMLAWPWRVAAVKPAMCEQFVAGVRQLGFTVRVLSDYRELPIKVDVDVPERVGIDRLLSAVGAACRTNVGCASAIVSAGTAVTIDLVDGTSAFRGGVILPGFRMMARSLHEQTALLPLIENAQEAAAAPARNTESAIRAGLSSAISGAVDRVVEQYRWMEPELKVIVTGGDAEHIQPRYCKPIVQPILALLGLTVVASGEQ